jgi:hypothetical protein
MQEIIDFIVDLSYIEVYLLYCHDS